MDQVQISDRPRVPVDFSTSCVIHDKSVEFYCVGQLKQIFSVLTLLPVWSFVVAECSDFANVLIDVFELVLYV